LSDLLFQSFPPVYNISAFNVPTYVYSGERDFLSTPQVDIDVP